MIDEAAVRRRRKAMSKLYQNALVINLRGNEQHRQAAGRAMRQKLMSLRATEVVTKELTFLEKIKFAVQSFI